MYHDKLEKLLKKIDSQSNAKKADHGLGNGLLGQQCVVLLCC